ncbi:MAG: hypothetical protein ACRDI2_21885, partial [Chloroflexota bacterium]
MARWDGIALIIAAVLVLFRLATYDAYADGPWGRHATATLAGAILAGALWIAVKLRTPMRSAVPAVTALLVMLSGDVVHLLRWTHPLTRQGQVVVYEETFRSSALAPQRWATQTEGEGEARVEDGKFILQNGPEAAAFVDLNLGDEEDGGRPLGPWFGRAILPVDYGTWLTKRVSWSASVQLAGTYYTVLELVEHRVLIQAVASGLLVSYPGETAEMASAFVSGPDLSDGTEHVWTVVQSPVRLAVY